ncbi:hypothetical protein [Streptomyces justiciae]|uniref:hypothetical protein n=1 Tax=Streptomyces justiciae TaxID=2780140 RepID=UPI002118D5E4|nr:hypothetical protein [Streptomyces justiciae]MCW8382683.1 hypothetical protein [Streptomyces justiciae]
MRSSKRLRPRNNGAATGDELPFRVDRALSQLTRSRTLVGLRGIALGQFPGFERDVDDPTLGG